MNSLISLFFSSGFSKEGSYFSNEDLNAHRPLGTYSKTESFKKKNRGIQYLVLQIGDYVQSDRGSLTFSLSYKMWRFFLNLENRVFFLKSFFQKPAFQKKHGLNILSFDYLSFFYNNFTQGGTPTRKFIQRCYKRANPSFKLSSLPVVLKTYVTKLSFNCEHQLTRKSLFHFFRTYDNFYSAQFKASINFFNS